MVELWDDRCVQVVANTGRTLADERAAAAEASRGKAWQPCSYPYCDCPIEWAGDGPVPPTVCPATTPLSLRASPNIRWEDQTVDQLRAELAHWTRRLQSARGLASAAAAARLARGCAAWIERREREGREIERGVTAP